VNSLSKPIRQLLDELIDIVGRDKQLVDPFCETLRVLGNHQQTLPDIPRAGKKSGIEAFLVTGSLDAADLLERQEQAVFHQTRHEADGNARGGDDICCLPAEELCILVEQREHDEHDHELPEVQSKLSPEQEGGQNTAADQEGDIPGGSDPGYGRLIEMELPAPVRILALHIRDPRRGLPAQRHYADHDDQEEQGNQGWGIRPERNNGDPCIWVLLQEENGESEDETVEKWFHKLIINRGMVIVRKLNRSQGSYTDSLASKGMG